MNQALEGTETVLIMDGVVDHAALKKETLTEPELLGVIRKQGFEGFDDLRRCVLQPNGTFYIEGKIPSADDLQRAALMNAVERLTREVQELRSEVRSRP